MHELGVAQSILDVVEQHVPRERAADVRAVRVRVGALSGVLADALDFCFSAVAEASAFRSAYLVIERVPVVGECLQCGASFDADGPILTCPSCAEGRVRLRSGTELQVLDVALEEPVGERA